MIGFRELIRKVQQYSGFSDSESKDALELMIESLSVHLTDRERRAFASQLPQELQDIALSVMPTVRNSQQDMLEQFMEMEHIDKGRAKRQMLCAWQALKDALGERNINHIRTQLPRTTTALLH